MSQRLMSRERSEPSKSFKIRRLMEPTRLQETITASIAGLRVDASRKLR